MGSSHLSEVDIRSRRMDRFGSSGWYWKTGGANRTFFEDMVIRGSKRKKLAGDDCSPVETRSGRVRCLTTGLLLDRYVMSKTGINSSERGLHLRSQLRL